MPVYDYKCECGEAFEAKQRMADRATAKCPTCFQFAPRILSWGASATIIPDAFRNPKPSYAEVARND